jgi:protoporphyrinogen oxidase
MTIILGGGMTGLAAGMTSGCPVFEASAEPGGICSSYYVRPGQTKRLHTAPEDGEAYRFEIGGGHWIFGGDPTILKFIDRLVPARRYNRLSAVYFCEDDLYVDYPIQNNLKDLPAEVACKALVEMSKGGGPFRTMKDWQFQYFGPTLCEKFFFPFHQLYTAGLYETIAPQDAYKSPVSLPQAIRGAFAGADAVGYNVSFAYPAQGLNALAQAMASRCDLRFGKRVVKIDPARKTVTFADGEVQSYGLQICTLPLNKTLEMAGLRTDAQPDPYTSVLVLNIGAIKGPKCPPHHWLYNPDAKSGLHRVGFYSNVDPSFLPLSARKDASAVSIYIERAYPGGNKPTAEEVARYSKAVVTELTDWGYIDRAEVVDPTWIDVAYTWERPGSSWKAQAMRLLQEHDIYMVGRYARWIFQGIADSIKDGFYAGASLRGDRTDA